MDDLPSRIVHDLNLEGSLVTTTVARAATRICKET